MIGREGVQEQLARVAFEFVEGSQMGSLRYAVQSDAIQVSNGSGAPWLR